MKAMGDECMNRKSSSADAPIDEKASKKEREKRKEKAG